MRLKDKVAIVTGAGQTPGDTIGNGRATAILFAREGAKVLLVDRRAESAHETEGMIAAEGGTASVFEADVTREEDCRAIAAVCVEAFGRIDVLHNNVGIGGGDAGATHLDLEVWKRIIDVNLTAMFLTCKHVLPQMREQRSGAIINISSLASIASTGMLAYKVSKAGVNALTKSLAKECASAGVRVNCIAPGLIATDMGERMMKFYGEALLSGIPLGRAGQPEDIGNAAVYLASDDASFVTGKILRVDGGAWM